MRRTTMKEIPFAKPDEKTLLDLMRSFKRHFPSSEVFNNPPDIDAIREATIPANTFLPKYNLLVKDEVRLCLFSGRVCGCVWNGIVVLGRNKYGDMDEWSASIYDLADGIDPEDREGVELLKDGGDPLLLVAHALSDRDKCLETLETLPRNFENYLPAGRNAVFRGCPLGVTLGEYFDRWHKRDLEAHGCNSVEDFCEAIAELVGEEGRIPDRGRMLAAVRDEVTVGDLLFQDRRNGAWRMLAARQGLFARKLPWMRRKFLSKSFLPGLKAKLASAGVVVPTADEAKKAKEFRLKKTEEDLSRRISRLSPKVKEAMIRQFLKGFSGTVAIEVDGKKRRFNPRTLEPVRK